MPIRFRNFKPFNASRGKEESERQTAASEAQADLKPDADGASKPGNGTDSPRERADKPGNAADKPDEGTGNSRNAAEQPGHDLPKTERTQPAERKEAHGIKAMSEDERPREKLMSKGVEAMTTPELLAILIGSGTTKKTAVELMKEVMDDCDNRLSNLSKMSMEELMNYKGIAEAKALSIIAAAEIGRRRSLEKVTDQPCMDQSQKVYDYMHDKVQDLTHEQSWALLLNNSARLIKCVLISTGGLASTAVDVRMLLKKAILADATCFILVHNHPSGSLVPSADDKALTEAVRKAGDTVKITMLDHVIVTDGGYYSFADRGML